MKVLVLFFLIVADVYRQTVLANEEYKIEEGAIVLTKTNFDKVILENQFVLVKFYSSDSDHSLFFAPKYTDAAEKIAKKELPFKLAQVDALAETELAERFEIHEYPTLKFFRKGVEMDYTGGHTGSAIVNWLRKKTGAPVIGLETVRDTEILIDESEVTIIGFFKDQSSDNSKLFVNIADSIDEQTFAVTHNPDVFKKYQITEDSIILFKKFDDGPIPYSGAFEETLIRGFISIESNPVYMDLSQETQELVFHAGVDSLLYILLSKKRGHYNQYIKGIRRIAKPFRGKMLFVSVNIDLPNNSGASYQLRTKDCDVPTMRILRTGERDEIYIPEKHEPTVENIQNFVHKYLRGEIEKNVIKQAIPNDWDKNPVKILVRDNFDQVVFNSSLHVLVFFHSTYSQECKDFMSIYDALGKRFKESETVVIAKIDGIENELEHFEIYDYPTFKLFRIGNNRMVKYNGPLNLDSLTEFIVRHEQETKDEL